MSQEMRRTCKRCGADLPIDASLCPFCMEEQGERLRIEPPVRRRKKPWIIALALLCALGIAAAWWFGNSTNTQEPPPVAVGEEIKPDAPAADESVEPEPTPTLTPTPSPSPEPTPEPIPTPTPTPEPTPESTPSSQPSAAPSTGEIPPTEPQEEPQSSAQNPYQGEAQVTYSDEDGAYDMFLMLHSSYPARPQALHTVELAAGESTRNPSQLYIVPQKGAGTLEEFMEKVESVHVETVPLDGGQAMEYTQPAYSPSFPGAVLMSHVRYTPECGTNEIIWTVNMKNGDTVCLTHRIKAVALVTVDYDAASTPMKTEDDLRALLARIEAETSADTVVNLHLPAVTYKGAWEFSGRKFNLYGSTTRTEQTTFTGPVSIRDSTDALVENINFVGSGAVGLSATAGLTLQNCRFSGWDVGVAVENGGWVAAKSCVFEENGVGFAVNSRQSTFADFRSTQNQFLNNGTALRLTQVPANLILNLSGSLFRGNETDIQNDCDHPLNLNQVTFE